MQKTEHLIDYVLPTFDIGKLNQILWVILGSALIALSSKIQLPIPAVPFTMQSYVILVLSMAMGFRMATATILLYLAEGALGLPVFASGAGIAYMMGPTGGYLLGFLLSAMTVGYLADCGFDKKLSTAVIAMVIGTAVLFVPGVLWLSHLLGIEKALNVGLHPFWFGMIFKLVLGAVTLPLAWKFVQRKR
ncbi:MAG: biotin transporter BioY [Gammaproteobacteria bacterium]|nr:biotin transporter BioY [Gammaproteobacteria bacterium]